MTRISLYDTAMAVAPLVIGIILAVGQFLIAHVRQIGGGK